MPELEAVVVDALKNNLMHPDVVGAFVGEFHPEVDRQRHALERHAGVKRRPLEDVRRSSTASSPPSRTGCGRRACRRSSMSWSSAVCAFDEGGCGGSQPALFRTRSGQNSTSTRTADFAIGRTRLIRPELPRIYPDRALPAGPGTFEPIHPRRRWSGHRGIGDGQIGGENRRD